MPAPPGPSVPAMVRISVPLSEAPILRLPQPGRASDDGLTIRIEQPPDQGRLMLDGRPLDPAQPLAWGPRSARLRRARTVSRARSRSSPMSLTDKWAQTARGVRGVPSTHRDRRKPLSFPGRRAQHTHAEALHQARQFGDDGAERRRRGRRPSAWTRARPVAGRARRPRGDGAGARAPEARRQDAHRQPAIRLRRP